MSFPLLPKDVNQQFEAGYALPSSLRSFQLQNAMGFTMERNWGTAYIQVVAVNGFWLSYQILRFHYPTDLIYGSNDSTAVLHYVPTGSMKFISPELDEPILYNEAQYGVSLHTINHTIQLRFNQGEHHFFQVAFSQNMLTLLLGKPIEKIARSNLSLSGWFSSPFPIYKRIHALLQRVLYHAHRLNSSIIPLNTGILQLLDRFAKSFLQSDITSRWKEKKSITISELSSYIEDHLDFDTKSALAIAVLARRTRITPYQLQKLFKQHYGASLAQFIQKKRMEKAAILLTQSLLPVGAVYLQVGYGDFSSFSRAFATYFGYSPSDYKKDEKDNSL